MMISSSSSSSISSSISISIIMMTLVNLVNLLLSFYVWKLVYCAASQDKINQKFTKVGLASCLLRNLKISLKTFS
uniref:Uncharacterized protein n=1 Tax=Glossina palpalis gambiensis TaxID=67801 RepID=A0A1B0BMJ1_9MUSC